MPRTGQAWTTPDELGAHHVNAWRRLEPDLFEISTLPAFAIGQRALLVCTPAGNVLWDCVALLDDATADGCPVYLHAADREWIMRPDPAIQHWGGDTLPLGPALARIRLGGHFPGSTVLHWPRGHARLACC